MSLNGNLEDLPLLDIIQIVSFSKKTGFLAIETERGQAAIVFNDGSIVASFTPESLPVDPRSAELPPAKRSALVRSRIEMALEQLIRLREGPFHFSLTDAPPAAIGGRDITAETLGAGINAQELLLDLARGIDEDRRDSTAALEASFAEPPEEPTPAADAPAPEPAESPAPEPTVVRADGDLPPAAPGAPDVRTVLLVDDEDEVRQLLGERLAAAGYEVREADEPDAAVKAAGALARQGAPFLLVTDLGMPTSGGASFQGGFEVVKRLWKMNLQPQVLLMTESVSPALRARAKQMGIASLVFKPGLSKLDPQQFEADMRAFAARVVDDILPRLAARAGSGRAPGTAPAGKAVSARPAPPPPTAEQLSREFGLLQRHLSELRQTTNPNQISALVMRVSREFFERAILFLVKNEQVRGLGGFGPGPGGESLNLLVRDIAIPLSEPSPFLDVVGSRKPWSGGAPEGKWGNHLIGRIGRFRTTSAALLPLLTHRETIALLYGDNAETGRELGRLDALEVFIHQAGVALENAFLQRKLTALAEAASDPVQTGRTSGLESA